MLLIGSSLLGQDKQPVFPIVEEIHEVEWYKEQWGLWKEDALNGSKSENAWYNYYAASRALRNLVDASEKEPYYTLCHSISKQMLEKFPESFEANYVAFWDQGLSNSSDTFLWKAHKINPNDARLWDELLINYELNGKTSERKAMATKMVSENYLAASVLNWGYNVLSELDDNAIILSVGDNDTYALWLNQFGLNFREDVTVLNIHMATLPAYRARIFKALGIPNIDQEGISTSKVIEHVMLNAKAPVYLASTAFGYMEELELKEHLYLTGLTYKYAAEPIDNLSLIRRNFEKRYALDYLTLQFSSHRMDGIAEGFKQFYIAPLVKLYHMYTESEEIVKKEETAELLLKLAKGGYMEAEVNKLLKD